MITQILQLDPGFEHYLPLAKNLARQVFATGQESFSRSYPVVAADGVQGGRIVVHGLTDNNLNLQTIKIQLIGDTGTPYLDSGLVDCIDTSPKGAQRFTSGEVFTGDALNPNKSWGSMSPYTLQHTPAKDPANPLAVPPVLPVVDGSVCGAFEATYPPEPTEAQKLADPNAYQAWLDAKAGLDNELLSKKVMATRFPSCLPSLFSGKARLWVQSVWGKKFSATEMAKYVGSNKDGLVIELPLNGAVTPEKHTVRSAITGSSGVYTDANFNYWQVDIGSPTTNICRLRLSAVGRSVIALMKSEIAAGRVQNTRIGRAKFEAIALSTAVPDHASKWIQIPTSGVATVASPLYYWWSWNWDGNRADVITHEGKTNPAALPRGPGYGGIAGDMYYTAHHYRFTISRDVSKVLTTGQTEKDRWASKIEQVVQNDWWPAMQGVPNQVVWVPEIAEQVGLAPFGATNMLYPPPPLPGRADIYCFYDVNDALKTFDIGYTAGLPSAVTERNNWDDPIAGPYSTYVLMGSVGANTSSRKKISAYSNNTISYLAGHSSAISSAAVDDSVVITGGCGDNDVAIVDGPETGQVMFPYFTAGTYSMPSYYGWLVPFGTSVTRAINNISLDATGHSIQGMRIKGSQVYSTYGESKSVSSCMAIPYGDCSAVYVGTVDRTSITPTTNTAIQSWNEVILVDGYYGGGGPPDYNGPSTFTLTILPGIAAAGAISVDYTIPAATNTSIVDFKCHTYSGTKEADRAYMTEIFMTCPHWFRRDYGGVYTNADMLYTTSSAVTGDTIGKTFTTGGYSGVPGDAVNKCFIGFA